MTQSLEQFGVPYLNIPDAINLARVVVPLAVTVAVGKVLRKDLKEVREAQPPVAVDFSINGPAADELVKRAYVDTDTKDPATDAFFNARRRLVSRSLMGVGIVGVTSVLSVNPTITETTTTPAAHPTPSVAFALNSSYSEKYTKDISDNGHYMSRFASSADGILNASYSGNMSVTEFGSGGAIPNTSVTFGPKNNSALEGLKPLNNDEANGDCVVDGLNTAAETLPTNDKGQHIGELILISDGFNIDTDCPTSAQSLGDEASTLHSEGVKVKVVVPGTSGHRASYSIDQSGGTPSDVEQVGFANVFGSENVITTANQKDIATSASVEAAIEKAETDAETKPKAAPTIRHEQLPLYPIYAIPAAVGIWGWLRDRKRVRKVALSN